MATLILSVIGSDRPGLTQALAAAVLSAGARPFEVPIAYYGRTHDEGKKITWRDGVHCVWILARSRAHRRRATVAPPREWAQRPTVELVGPPERHDGVAAANGKREAERR